MADRTYEALLIYSAWDEELAKKLWRTLQAKGLNITQHQDPDGPFLNTETVFDNMVNAIEMSDKILVFFTKKAVESGFVSLEIMLALEKSQRLGQMCLYLIALGLGEEEICSLKQGLLGSVPHIPVNVNIEGWEDNLLTGLRGINSLFTVKSTNFYYEKQLRSALLIRSSHSYRLYLSISILTLDAPIATKVDCFSRLLKCLRSLYGKQCGPNQTALIGPVCSGSTLFASILNLSVILGNYLQRTTSADNIFTCIFF